MELVMDFKDWSIALFLLLSFVKENKGKEQKELEGKPDSYVASYNMIKALNNCTLYCE